MVMMLVMIVVVLMMMMVVVVVMVLTMEMVVVVVVVVVVKVALVDIRGRVNKRREEGSDYSSTTYEGLKEDYLDAHIPGAVFVDWTKVSNHSSEAQRVAPTVQYATFTSAERIPQSYSECFAPKNNRTI